MSSLQRLTDAHKQVDEILERIIMRTQPPVISQYTFTDSSGRVHTYSPSEFCLDSQHVVLKTADDTDMKLARVKASLL